MRFLAHSTFSSLAVAGISENSQRADTDDSHFSFMIYTVCPEDFATAIEQCIIALDDCDMYSDLQEIVLQGTRHYDTIRIVRDGQIVSITRGNLKVLFYGSLAVLRGLPKAIRKAIQKRNKLHEKCNDEDLV